MKKSPCGCFNSKLNTFLCLLDKRLTCDVHTCRQGRCGLRRSTYQMDVCIILRQFLFFWEISHKKRKRKSVAWNQVRKILINYQIFQNNHSRSSQEPIIHQWCHFLELQPNWNEQKYEVFGPQTTEREDMQVKTWQEIMTYLPSSSDL